MRALYAFFFFGGVREIIPIYPLYAIMFTENGVTPFELSLLFSIWASVGLLLEVPSGALADRFSRKWLIVLSSVFKSAGFIAWFLFPAFWGYALGFVLWGIGSTLRSGAFEALLHDLLATDGRQSDFGRLYGRILAVGSVGVVLGELSGGLLISQGYDAVLLVSAALPLIATLPFALFVHDPPKDEAASDAHYLALLRDGVREAIVNPAVRFIILAYGLLIVTFGVYDEFVAPTFREFGFSLAAVAYLCVIVLMAQSAGQWLADKFEHLTLGGLFGLIAISAAALILVPYSPGVLVVALIAGFFFMFGLSMTLFQARLQSEIQGASRATVTSVSGMADGIGAIVWYLIFGTMAEASGMAGATLGLGVIVVGLCAVFHRLAIRWQISR